jgi:hypothetical protein
VCACRKQETRGPKWVHPNLLEVLSGVPFLRNVDTQLLEWIRLGHMMGPAWAGGKQQSAVVAMS